MTTTSGGRPKKSDEPMIRDPRLASELLRLRRNAGKTGDEVAALLGWSPSKVSRVEHCRSGIRRSDLGDFLRACDVPVARGQAVFALAATLAAETAQFPGGHFAGAVHADAVLDWAPSVVPWLLQAPAYTEALLASRQQVERLSPGALSDLLDAVFMWQERLARDMTMRAVLGEAVLYQRVGDERVMRTQLEKLSRPGGRDIQVRILPQDRGRVVGYDSFSYLEFAGIAGVGGTPRVMTYQLGRSAMLDDDGVVWRHKLVFEEMWEASDPPGPAVKQALADAWGG